MKNETKVIGVHIFFKGDISLVHYLQKGWQREVKCGCCSQVDGTVVCLQI